jgi:3-phosphoshikimate 1-carboxyvinyltransferase
MACAVAALGAEGDTIIHNAECVKKSYPRFFNDLHSLGGNLVGRKFDR